ncbi:MAG: methylglyoxal synthase [Firmicutes bacterium GWF2_51_9]|jgi:methylglyoxal synthase|nr:MAG: methylglyoxal synthase [Firmicutes bacterium GWF2_51_9]OGS59284.1 MAG: methylglyoxal synthase [Firmicutes bacterium GWE2_51_13]HAM62897.1 methylglyoxal synthase [Erysipelotrichaceae bacterium]HAO62200.1 methylglyoxal synthase [Erysipelotrichaceae bacterium]HBZ40403.1 methylglyoxal synthase [Erysipelotrichaceae bacterium]
MKKTIALIAHDHCKEDLVTWAQNHMEILKQHDLCGTRTTATKISEETGLDVFAFLSGPKGGDQQIGAKIAEGKIDVLIFFWDPLASMPHDPDVKALLRLSVLANIPTASNPATANLVLNFLK